MVHVQTTEVRPGKAPAGPSPKLRGRHHIHEEEVSGGDILKQPFLWPASLQHLCSESPAMGGGAKNVVDLDRL